MTRTERLAYHALRILFLLFGLMPVAMREMVADSIGRIWFAVDLRHRRVTMENMRIAFGTSKSRDEIRRLSRRVFQNIARIPFEIGWSYRLDEKNYQKHFRFQGLSHLKAAYAQKKGVLVLTAHSGNWELMPSAVQLAGYPANVIYRPLSFQPADRYLYEYRVRFGVRMFQKKHSMRKILRAIDRKECVGIVLDQNAGYTAGVFADFLGKPATTNMGLALVALKLDLPVLPIFLYRCGRRYCVEIGAEIPVARTGNKDRDVIVNCRNYNKAIEEFVLRHPDQWFWVHDRFKDQPRPEDLEKMEKLFPHPDQGRMRPSAG